MMKAKKCNEGSQGIYGQLAWCSDRDDRGGKGHCNGGNGRGGGAKQDSYLQIKSMQKYAIGAIMGGEKAGMQNKISICK